MNDVIESLAEATPATDDRATRKSTTGAPRSSPVRHPRRHDERWVSTLGPADLGALIRILESELIPRLVAGYAPARQAPLAGGPPGR